MKQNELRRKEKGKIKTRQNTLYGALHILPVRAQQLFDFSINLNIWHYQE
jgi:hypothetical protein